jgi:hypothetical protein
MEQWKKAIRSWIIENKVEKTSVNQICEECFKKDRSELTVKDRRDIIEYLKSLGWETKHVRINGEAVHGLAKIKPPILDEFK